jgi:hypothetical protein
MLYPYFILYFVFKFTAIKYFNYKTLLISVDATGGLTAICGVTVTSFFCFRLIAGVL